MQENETTKFLLNRKIELETELEQLNKILAELKKSDKPKPSDWQTDAKKFWESQINSQKILSYTRTGQFWFKNRFNPAEGYATSNYFRILSECQDEGPNFLPYGYENFQDAKKYTEMYANPGTVYTIISPEGEIVK